MTWFTSRLFWRIFGTYVLFTTIALSGLLLTYDHRIQLRAVEQLQEDSEFQLRRCQRILISQPVESGEQVLVESLLQSGQILWQCDHDGDLRREFGLRQSEDKWLSRQQRQKLIESALKTPGTVSFLFRDDDSLQSCCLANVKDHSDILILLWRAEAYLAEKDSHHDAVLSGIILTWICCTACVALVTMIIAAPVHRLTVALGRHEPASTKRDILIEMAERNDAFGAAAIEQLEMIQDYDRQIQGLHQKETEVRSSALQLATMLQSMVEGVIAVDAEEKVLFINQVACSMLELQTDGVVGRPVFELVRNTHFHEVVSETVSNTKYSEIEFKLARNNMYVQVSVSPIPTGGAVIVMDDITEMRRLEAMRRDFVNGVSHELKTPLTVIQACTETLTNGAIHDVDAATNFLEQIQQQSDRLLELIVRMLQLARVESGELHLAELPVDLAVECQDVSSQLAPIADSKSLTLTVEGEQELFVLGDRDSIRVVIGSLVENAIKYTGAGGTVRIRLSVTDDAAMVQVIDNGIGIARNEQERVFERFYRVQKDRNRDDGGGTGLGLAIVKHLCQAMGAKIQLESVIGEGCTMAVIFPFRS